MNDPTRAPLTIIDNERIYKLTTREGTGPGMAKDLALQPDKSYAGNIVFRHMAYIPAVDRLFDGTPTNSTNIRFLEERVLGQGGMPREKAWYGVDGGPEEIERMLREGWPEGTKRTIKALGSITDSSVGLLSTRRRLRWQDEGDDIDITRVYSGDLDRAWLGTNREQRYDPTHGMLTIICNISANGSREANEFFWRGAAALALAHAAEASGRRVEILAYRWSASAYGAKGMFQSRDYPSVGLWLHVKHAGHWISVDRIAAALCLAGTMRHGFFYRQECSRHAASDFHGRSQIHPPPMDFLPFKVQPESCIVVTDIWTQDQADAFLRETVANLRGEGQMKSYGTWERVS